MDGVDQRPNQGNSALRPVSPCLALISCALLLFPFLLQAGCKKATQRLPQSETTAVSAGLAIPSLSLQEV